jgi:hypothetical protein
MPTAEPIPDAIVHLEPGRHLTSTDSTGAFRFVGVARGRYLLRVGAIPFKAAVDSVTYSEFGVAVVAVLAPYEPGLLARIRPGRRAPAPHHVDARSFRSSP